MLLCQTRFLGNYSCNYFSVPNPLALLTFSTCLISSSDFRNERADIWGGGDQHSTPDSFSSLISIISPCVPVLTEDDLGVPRLFCLQLLPMLVPLPRMLFPDLAVYSRFSPSFSAMVNATDSTCVTCSMRVQIWSLPAALKNTCVLCFRRRKP